MNTYYNPVRTYQGPGSLERLPALVKEAASENVRVLLLLCMETLTQNPVIQQLIRELGERVTIKCFPHSNPDLNQLFDLYTETKAQNTGLVVAIGGGSTLDVGKALCCLYGSDIGDAEQLRRIVANGEYEKPVCPWIGVPTTAGTGSEVTCWATVWHPEGGVKYSIDLPENYAYAAVADPELLYSMPLGLAVSSALDAVAHAAESYWAKASNTVSKALALSAVRMIMEHIDRLLEYPADPLALQCMSEGSMLAGLAFSNTKTTACHSISYPLTMEYHIPHGVAVSLLLAPVMRFNQAYIPGLPSLLEAFGAAGCDQLEERIHRILSRAGYPTALRIWGAQESQIPNLAAHGITKGRADNNPAPLTESAVGQILKTIF